MAFQPEKLPHSVQALFNRHIHTPSNWYIVVDEAVAHGIVDINILTDIMFYMSHPDLIRTPLHKSMSNYDALVTQWKVCRGAIKLRFKLSEWFGGDGGGSAGHGGSGASSWKPFADSIHAKSSFLPKPAKEWMAKPPKAEREVGLFASTKMDGSRPMAFYAWKTSEPLANCKTHNHHESSAFHGWFEQKFTLSAIKADHGLKTDWMSALGNDVGAKEIAAMNIGLNIHMFSRVMKKGICPRLAFAASKRAMADESKQIIQIAQAVIGGASGAKIGAVKGYTKLNTPRFIEKLYKLYKGDYGHSPEVEYGVDSANYDYKISGSGGRTLGWVKEFN